MQRQQQVVGLEDPTPRSSDHNNLIRPRAPCTQHTAQTGPQPLLSLQILKNPDKKKEGNKGVKERRLQNDQLPPKCQRFFMCLATVGSWRTRTYIEVCTYVRGKNTHARTRKEFSPCLWRIHIVAKFNELYLLSICTIIIAKFSSSWWGTYVCRYVCTYIGTQICAPASLLLRRGSRYIGTSYIPIWTSRILPICT